MKRRRAGGQRTADAGSEKRVRLLLPDLAPPLQPRLGPCPKTHQSRLWIPGCSEPVVAVNGTGHPEGRAIQGRQPQHGARSESWSPVERLQLRRLYTDMCQRFRQRIPYRTRRMAGHRCTPECRAHRNRRISQWLSVCIKSGAVHRCGPEHCRRQVQDTESAVCLLTGIQLPLPPAAEAAAHERSAPVQAVDGTAARAARRRASGPWIVRRRRRGGTSGTPAASVLEARQARIAVLADTESEDIARRRRSIFADTIHTLLRFTEFVPSTRQSADLTQMCEDLWRLVVSSGAYKYNSLAYNPVYHALVVLYCARDGLLWQVDVPDTDGGGSRTVTILEESQLLARHLPLRNRISSKFESRQLTVTERRFMNCLWTCSADSIIEYVRRVELGRDGEPQS